MPVFNFYLFIYFSFRFCMLILQALIFFAHFAYCFNCFLFFPQLCISTMRVLVFTVFPISHGDDSSLFILFFEIYKQISPASIFFFFFQFCMLCQSPSDLFFFSFACILLAFYYLAASYPQFSSCLITEA